MNMISKQGSVNQFGGSSGKHQIDLEGYKSLFRIMLQSTNLATSHPVFYSMQPDMKLNWDFESVY